MSSSHPSKAPSTPSEPDYQEQALQEFQSHPTSITQLTSNPNWSTNPEALLDMRPKMHDLISTFDELPHLGTFITNEPFLPSQLVGRLFTPQDWHNTQDFDLIFHAWDDLQPLIRSTEKGWLKYLPRNRSVILSNPITGGTFSHPDGLAVAIQEGTWLDYRGDLYKASWPHFQEEGEASDDARKICQRAFGILYALERAVRKEDSKNIVEVLFRAEKKLLLESEAFIKEEEGSSPW